MSRKKRRNAPRTRVHDSGVCVSVQGRGDERPSSAPSRRARHAGHQAQEADAWLRSRSSLDHGAVGRVPQWQSLVESNVDFQSDRTSERPPRPGVARFRRERLGDAACSACLLCERPPSDLMFESELRKARPGTDNPFSSCGSVPRDPVTPPRACFLSFVGELEPDRSLAATMDPRTWGPGGRRCDA